MVLSSEVHMQKFREKMFEKGDFNFSSLKSSIFKLESKDFMQLPEQRRPYLVVTGQIRPFKHETLLKFYFSVIMFLLNQALIDRATGRTFFHTCVKIKKIQGAK